MPSVVAGYRYRCPYRRTRLDLAGPIYEQRQAASAFESFLAGLLTQVTGLPGHRVDAEIESALRDRCEFLGTDHGTLVDFSVKRASLASSYSSARSPVEAYTNWSGSLRICRGWFL